jgi:hypothetical protein
MEPTVRTSFIPKQAIQVEHKRAAGNPVALVTIVAGVIFVGVLALAAGAFLYEQYLKQSIAAKGDSLDRSRAAFEPAIIQELARTDARISASQELVGGHVALSRLFAYLEDHTLASVQFTNFSYERVGPGRITLSMNGLANSYSAVALQSDLFGESDVLKEPIFADLNLDAQGNVVFSFTGLVETQQIRYQGGASAPAATTTSATSYMLPL